MPPEDQPQPQPEEVSKVVAWLTAAISEAQANRDSSGGETVLRRLNRREYRNTISDLLKLNMGAYDPTAGFPPTRRSTTWIIKGMLWSPPDFFSTNISRQPIPPWKRHWDHWTNRYGRIGFKTKTSNRASSRTL